MPLLRAWTPSSTFVIALATTVVVVLGCGACSDDGGADDETAHACVEIDYAGCTMLYPPTWDHVWTQTISTTCSGGGSACHALDVGLRFVDQAEAYEGLTTGTHAQVIAGDPQCSPIMMRLESNDPNYRMPPGNTALAEGARCSIATWIEAGAAQD